MKGEKEKYFFDNKSVYVTNLWRACSVSYI